MEPGVIQASFPIIRALFCCFTSEELFKPTLPERGGFDVTFMSDVIHYVRYI
jgi:hypothetical protein